MKKVLKTLGVLLLPLFLFLNVLQSFSYQQVESELSELEAQQKKMLEENKKMIIGIEFLRNPVRLEKAAKGPLDMERAGPERTIRIVISADGHDG